jgi:small nuclear ribonucleoprotein (snRNP)-like protein
MSQIGVPIKVLHEAEGHVISVELKNGEIYRGELIEAEDNMNLHLANVTHTNRTGKVAALEQVKIIIFLIIFANSKLKKKKKKIRFTFVDLTAR